MVGHCWCQEVVPDKDLSHREEVAAESQKAVNLEIDIFPDRDVWLRVGALSGDR